MHAHTFRIERSEREKYTFNYRFWWHWVSHFFHLLLIVFAQIGNRLFISSISEIRANYRFVSFRFGSRSTSRPLTSTTPAPIHYSSSTRSSPTVAQSTTPVPILLSAKSLSEPKSPSSIPLATLRVTMMQPPSTESPPAEPSEEHEPSSEEPNSNVVDELEASNHEAESQPPSDEEHPIDEQTIYEPVDTIGDDETIDAVEDTTSVEQRLKKISEEIEKYSNTDGDHDAHGRQSFFSLSDLIKTLRPADKKVAPQIDSDYSNTMHVLGETASIVGGDDGRKIKTIDLRQTNRALF